MIGLITYVSWTVFDGTLCVGKISLSMHSGLLQLLTMLQIFDTRDLQGQMQKLEVQAGGAALPRPAVLMSQQEGVPSFCGEA